VVHSVGGWVALAAIIHIGPRIGRFDDDKGIEPNSVTLTSLGVFLLWFGWLGFNGGSTLAASDRVPIILTNTIVGGVFGIVSTLVLTRIRYGKPRALDILNGSLGGLVAVTANCDAVLPWMAAVIGFVGGIVVIYTGNLLERFKFDDAVGAIPVHLGAGIWGTVAVAFFVSPPDGLDMFSFLGVQLLGVAVVALYVFPLAMLFFYVSGRFVGYRVSSQAEIVGLNIVEHDAQTSTLDLIRQMSYQASTGNFSRPVTVDTQTEAHHIATFYNAVLNRVNTEEQEKNTALERATWLAEHDPLTECLNRRTWYDAFCDGLDYLQPGQCCGVAMLDIDHFKQVNDNYGHVAGDAGILHVVRKIRQQLTANARLGRFGGEEFVVFLIQDNVGDSPEEPPIQQLAETIRQSITEKPLNFNGQEIALAASIGVTTCRSGEQPGEALSRADQALYKAKESGRNRVCFQ